MATNPRSAESTGTEFTSEARKAANQSTQTVRSMADATERTARAGAEAVRRSAETTNGFWLNGSETAGRIAQRSMDEISRMLGMNGDLARETIQQSSGNVQAVMESTSVVASGMQEVAGEWMRFAQEQVEQNLDHFDRLRQCRNVQDYLVLQTQIARENFEAFLQSARRTSERSTQIAGRAVQLMTESGGATR
jgi:hypothetical protein